MEVRGNQVSGTTGQATLLTAGMTIAAQAKGQMKTTLPAEAGQLVKTGSVHHAGLTTFPAELPASNAKYPKVGY